MIAVASGKGGVGKSTTAVNLALGLQAIGLKVGILDADIYGPSQPRLLGLSGRPQVAGGNKLRPMEAYGLKAMSMGFLVDEGTPIIWRGPMVVSALTQMLRDVTWGDLDALVIDMPPGTGDVQLTMAQQVPLSGAIIVSTPQDLALIDARKGLNMFRKVDVPVLGIIENMSFFVCPKCGERSDIFGHGGAKLEAEKLGIAFLGGVPLHMDIRVTSDEGQPITATNPNGPHAQIYRDIATKAWAELDASSDTRIQPPTLAVSPDKSELHVGVRGRKRVHLVGRDAARDEPVGGGAGPFARPARDGRPQAQRQDQGAASRGQLRRAHRVRRWPRHRALRLVVSADARSGAGEALGGIPLGVGGEGLEPELAAGADLASRFLTALMTIRLPSALSRLDGASESIEVGAAMHYLGGFGRATVRLSCRRTKTARQRLILTKRSGTWTTFSSLARVLRVPSSPRSAR